MTGLEVVAGKVVLKVFDWVWSSFGKELTQSATERAASQWKKFQFKAASEAYAQKMKKRYGQMQLWKMSAPTSVEKIFTQVNILQKQSAFRNIPKAQLEAIYLNQAGFGKIVEKGKDGMAAVKEADRLFILGKPGAGKTTFLKYIALEAIGGQFEAVPIFVTLRELSESKKDLMDFVIEQFDICGFPGAKPFIEAILKQGKAIVLFDGLDEVNKAGGLRDAVIRAIKNFSDTYDQSKVLITCRVAASEYSFEGFSVVEMADFDDAQIKTFVHKWFSDLPETANTFFKEFDQHAENRLRDLAKSPLLLTLLCIGFEETLHFPGRRSEIYGEALDALLKKRDSTRKIKRDTIYGPLSPGRKTQMFARIAAETFDKGDYLFEKKALQKKIVDYLERLPQAGQDEEIDGGAVLNEIVAQHGIFVERAKGVYSFAHLSFQEYYAAHYATSGAETRLSRLMRFVFDPRWREVFLLTAEMLDDADHFFDLLVNQLDDHAAKEKRLNALLIKGNCDFFKDRKAALSLIIVIHQNLPDSNPHFVFDKGADFIRVSTTGGNYSIEPGLELESILVEAISCFRAFSILPVMDEYHKAMLLAQEEVMDGYHKALLLSQEKGFDACHHSLAKLSLPPEEASGKVWKEFVQALHKTFITTFQIKDYKFTNEEASQVTKYLEATKLLLDCLKVAYVSNHAAIEDRLLRPVNKIR